MSASYCRGTTAKPHWQNRRFDDTLSPLMTQNETDFQADDDYVLGALLKSVSRSFYLTLRVLPDGLREPIGLAYLLARAADTIADTAIIPPDRRLQLLLSLRALVNGPYDAAAVREIESAVGVQQSDKNERKLLETLTPALNILAELSERDRDEVRRVVTVLTQGMEFDLNTFPVEGAGSLAALQNLAELDRYIYLVAGCVGEFWTKITMAHTASLNHWDSADMAACGIRFGKALQLTNVLRDCGKDLRIGRCYLPQDRLAAHGLVPEDLLRPENSARARPLLNELLRLALTHFLEARRYVLAIPPNCGRLRLACLWPVLLGLATLKELSANPDWLDPEKPSKVSRKYVYRTLAISVPLAGSDIVVGAWIDRLAAGVQC